MMTPTDRLDGGPADYKVPTGDYLHPGRTAPMPLPSVKIPIYQYVGFDFLVLDEMW
jgi:hypothetical protein